MDMRMPDMNGFEIATILKKHRVYRSIPILAATAFPDHAARQRCLSAGCDDFISKPFAFSALQTSLTNLVSGGKTKPTNDPWTKLARGSLYINAQSCL
jgi:two-component system, cell cycle response regulator DivK